MSLSFNTYRERNQLLAAVPFDDWRYIESHLEWVEMTAGSTLYQAGTSIRFVYFPATAVVSLVSSLFDGGTVEVAAVGNEGLVGVDAFMGSINAASGTTCAGTVTAHTTALVQRSGHGYRMSAQSIAHHARRSSHVLHHLLNYTRTLLQQISLVSACNRHHSLDQQLARWLLVHLERQEDDHLRITQEGIAKMIGVRREAVTGGILRLQKEGFISNGRGHLTVLDRASLEARSCECHSAIRDAYSQLQNDAVMQVGPELTCAPIQVVPLQRQYGTTATSMAAR